MSPRPMSSHAVSPVAPRFVSFLPSRVWTQRGPLRHGLTEHARAGKCDLQGRAYAGQRGPDSSVPQRVSMEQRGGQSPHHAALTRSQSAHRRDVISKLGGATQIEKEEVLAYQRKRGSTRKQQFQIICACGHVNSRAAAERREAYTEVRKRRRAVSVCEHQCIRSQCQECGGSCICPHQHQEHMQGVRVRGQLRAPLGRGCAASRRKECRVEADQSMPVWWSWTIEVKFMFDIIVES